MPDWVRHNLKKIMTDDLMTKFTWNGTKGKASIKTYFIIKILKGKISGKIKMQFLIFFLATHISFIK